MHASSMSNTEFHIKNALLRYPLSHTGPDLLPALEPFFEIKTAIVHPATMGKIIHRSLRQPQISDRYEPADSSQKFLS